MKRKFEDGDNNDEMAQTAPPLKKRQKLSRLQTVELHHVRLNETQHYIHEST